MATVASKSRVETVFESPAPRPNGMTGSPEGLWVAHPSDDVIAKYDVDTGDRMDAHELPEGSPEPHGLTYWRGDLWYCEATSDAVCRVYRN